jgi:hypothetical protein
MRRQLFFGAAFFLAAALPVVLVSQQPQGTPPAQQPDQAPGGVFRLPSPYEAPKEAGPPKPEEPKKTVLTNTGKPIAIPFACTEDDMQAHGMSCTEENPCPVYADLTSVYPLASKIFIAGNLHDGSSTLYSLLLVSEDEGKTWSEPVERIKGAGLDHIQFVDFETGWISGQSLGALPRDPFFLITTDGGKSFRKRPVFNESRVGVVDRYWFESRTAGTMIIDRMAGAENNARYELHETMTGGDTWMIRQVSPQAPALKGGRTTEAATGWRLRADQRTKAHIIERRQGAGHSPVATFLVKVGECKPALTPLAEPPPPPEPPSPAEPAGRPKGPSQPPTLKKKP